jgi:hypothetical protein
MMPMMMLGPRRLRGAGGLDRHGQEHRHGC